MNKFKGLLLLIAISAGLNVYAVTQAPVSKTPVTLQVQCRLSIKLINALILWI